MIEPAKEAVGVDFSVQLVEAYLYEAQIVRRSRTAVDADEPSLNAGPRSFSHDETNSRLVVLLGAEIKFPFSGDRTAIAEVTCSVFGVFSYSGKPQEQVLQAFPGREGLIILWPYLRAYVAQIAGMTGLHLPPVPTLDVLATLGRTIGDQPAPTEG